MLSVKIRTVILYFCLFLFSNLTAQVERGDVEGFFSTDRFYDSSHHWYDINDDDKIIFPLKDQLKYRKFEIEQVGDNILLFQKSNGGWAKNYDMFAILTTEQIDSVLKAKNQTNTTFDNRTTHSQVSYLAELYSITKKDKFKNGFLNGMNFILEAQYENGGWPQFYPDTSGYRKHITFNDMAMIDIMKLLQKVVYKFSEYDFVDDELRMKIIDSYTRGLKCILDCQILENEIKLAWCQQHDSKTFEPVDARIFEKASICNYESAEIVKLLMSIRDPNKEIIESIESAMLWFEKSAISGIRIEWFETDAADFIYHSTNLDRKVIEDSFAPRIWARFYELNSHRPIFCGRDGEVKYAMSEIDRDRRTGYGWYTYAPEELFDIYKFWKFRIGRKE